MPRWLQSALHHLPLVALLGILAATLLYPIGLTVRGGFAQDPATGTGWTLEHIAGVLRDPTRVQGVVNALKIALASTALCVLIGLPLAILTTRYRFPGSRLVSALVLLPLILPPFVGAIGLQMILGRAGAMNSLLGTDFDLLGEARLLGVIVVQALHLYPIIYVNAAAALANLDPALDEAAENLGAGPWRRLCRITIPLMRSGLFAGATIVLVWSFTELGTPLVFEYRTVTAVQIFDGLKSVENSAEPYALTVVMLAIAVALYALGKAVLGRSTAAMQSKASRASELRPMSARAGWAATILCFGVIALAVLPHIGVLLTSVSQPWAWYRSVLPTSFTGEHYRAALSDPLAIGSIGNSLLYSSLAVVACLVLGVSAGWIIARTKLIGRSLLDGLCMLPLAVPGLVMAFGYVAMTLRWPFGTGQSAGPLSPMASVFGVDPNPLPLLVIAYAVRRLPYVVRSTVAGLEQTPVAMEEAAANLGASGATTMRRIVLPLIAANLLAAGLLVFSFSMLEVSDSLILAQQQDDYPITKAIYAFAGRLADGVFVASAMGAWGMVLLASTLVGASLLLGKKLGGLFRA